MPASPSLLLHGSVAMSASCVEVKVTVRHTRRMTPSVACDDEMTRVRDRIPHHNEKTSKKSRDLTDDNAILTCYRVININE